MFKVDGNAGRKVVEHSPQHFKFEGLSPVTNAGSGREKMTRKKAVIGWVNKLSHGLRGQIYLIIIIGIDH